MNQCQFSLDINLTKINVVANQRDLKLWQQQATAKYYKQKYEEVRRENEILGSKIKKIEEKMSKTEKKLPEVTALSERIASSVIIASNTTDHLIQLKLCVKNEVALLEKEFETLIEKYSNMYKQRRMVLETKNPFYNELSEITLNVEKLKIQKNILLQDIIDKKKIIKQKIEINDAILKTNIVDLVKVIINARKVNSIRKEVAEKRAEAHNLLELYEKQNEIKRNIKKCDKPQSDLPKRLIEMKPMYKKMDLNMPSFTTPLQNIQNSQKLVTMPKVNEISLLKKLKERSAERLKIIWQWQNSNVQPVENIEPHRKSGKENSTPATNVINENKHAIPKEGNSQTSPKINILQNKVIINNNDSKNNQIESQKRPAKEMKGIIKKKKTKRVSFGEGLSQDDPVNVLTNSENNADSILMPSEEIQEYVSTKSNENIYQQAITSVEPRTEHPTMSQFSYNDDQSFYMPKGQNEAVMDNTFFSMSRSAENIFDQTEGNTFFSLINPNSQENASVDNNFSLFRM